MGIENYLRYLISHPIALAAIVCFLFICLLIFLCKTKRSWYVKQESIFTKSELKFYHVLQNAIGDNYALFAKVRFADVIKPRPGLSNKEWGRAFAKIKAKHIDFALCYKDDLSFACMIELDDRSHERQDRIDRDLFVDNALFSAGIPIVHIKTAKHYDIGDIRNQLSEFIQI